MTTRHPTHPGEILLHHYLSERGIGISEFAGVIGIHRTRVSAIVNGRGRVTPEAAVRFADALDTTPQLWLNRMAPCVYNRSQVPRPRKARKPTTSVTVVTNTVAASAGSMPAR